jgi:hypothetical protein
MIAMARKYPQDPAENLPGLFLSMKIGFDFLLLCKEHFLNIVV